MPPPFFQGVAEKEDWRTILRAVGTYVSSPSKIFTV
jgi:hypothetical protein